MIKNKMCKFKAKVNRRVPTKKEIMTTETDKMGATTIRTGTVDMAKKVTITTNIVKSSTSQEMTIKTKKSKIMRDNRDSLPITNTSKIKMMIRMISSSTTNNQIPCKRMCQLQLQLQIKIMMIHHLNKVNEEEKVGVEVVDEAVAMIMIWKSQRDITRQIVHS